MSETETKELTTSERMLLEIEAERKEVQRDTILTVTTLIGLICGVYFTITEASPLLINGALFVAFMAGGFTALKEALHTLFKEHSVDIDLLMVLAALAAAAVGQPIDGAILLFLFSLAGTLEGYAMGNTKRAVAALMKLRPDEANVLTADGNTVRTRVEHVSVGQQLIVKPGERIPLDGKVSKGQGAVDESSLTGESAPVDKDIDDVVFSGTVNQNAVLTITVTKTADQSTLARMIEMVTEAQDKRSPSENFSDWFGEKYTYVVLFGSVAALLGFLLAGLPTDLAFYKAATLLVVASPCAIVISVPAAILSAIASAARTGALFKGGAAIEEFGSVATIAFDKTGTLTNGKMVVTDVVVLDSNLEDTELLKIAGAIEAHSEHPVAESIRIYAKDSAITIPEASDTVAVPGKGITAVLDGISYLAGNRALLTEKEVTLSSADELHVQALENEGKTTVIIVAEQTVLGVIAVADTLRESAIPALATLKKQGITNFVMLTGDNHRVANAIGAKLGLTPQQIKAELLPEDKVKAIQELREHGKITFVGDGVNDAAALATANVGVAMGVGGSDVAIEAADVALLSDDLTKLATAHKLTKDANRIIRQNLYFAVGIMALMVGTTIFFYLPLPLGVIGHEGGTLLVVANGLRLLFRQT